MATDLSRIRYLFADIDDTISTEGKITLEAYAALWHASEQGLEVVPVTGRPAGWCDHIARMWPVSGVVGENGGLYFRMADGKMERVYAHTSDERAGFRKELESIREEILAGVPGTGIASDQPYREYDLAVDYCEDVERLPPEAVQRIVEIFESHGATAKISSIHVNGWFGDFDKLTMTRRFAEEVFGTPLAGDSAFAFVGDSPNDEPMFEFFETSIGVANVSDFLDRMTHHPSLVTKASHGAGFAEAVEMILRARS